MANPLRIIFLGTAAGTPTLSRSCSSTAISLDSAIWLVDCAEGTERQILRARLKLNKIQKIFVTHLHMDHCMGIPPLVRSLLSSLTGNHRTPEARRLDIFGPRGLRELLRMSLTVTGTTLSGNYAVHELLRPQDASHASQNPHLHPNEALGRDLVQTDGCWQAFENDSGWIVSAAPIKHRVPCIGYVFQEAPRSTPLDPEKYLEPLDRNASALAAQGIRHPRSLLGQLRRSREPIQLPDGTTLDPPPLLPGRKLVMLGDTSDPSDIKELAMDASVLVHEATNAYIPLAIDPRGPKTDTEANVTERAVQRGHSTPVMAGHFARATRSRKLVLNHFGARFAAPGELSVAFDKAAASAQPDIRANMIGEIERQASETWGGGQAIAAYDLMCLDLD